MRVMRVLAPLRCSSRSRCSRSSSARAELRVLVAQRAKRSTSRLYGALEALELGRLGSRGRGVRRGTRPATARAREWTRPPVRIEGIRAAAKRVKRGTAPGSRRRRCAMAAASRRPGTRRRRAPPRGPPTAPRPRATARAGSRRPRRRRARWWRSSRVRPHVAARVELDAEVRRRGPSRTGSDEAHREQHQIRGELELAARDLARASRRAAARARSRSKSTRTARAASRRARPRPISRFVVERVVARAALRVRARRPEQSPGRAATAPSACAALGGARQQLDRRDRLRALPVRGADAVRAGVAAAEHDHVLAGREDRLARPGSRRRRRGGSAGSRKSIAKCTPASSRPGHGQVARLLGADAEQDRVEVAAQLARRRGRRRRARRSGTITPSSRICSSRRSMIHFSSLKSGMP